MQRLVRQGQFLAREDQYRTDFEILTMAVESLRIAIHLENENARDETKVALADASRLVRKARCYHRFIHYASSDVAPCVPLNRFDEDLQSQKVRASDLIHRYALENYSRSSEN